MGAVTIGSNFTSGTQDNSPCGGIVCTAITFDANPTLQAPGGLRSPIDGVVTSWGVKTGSSATLTLRVLRPAGGLSFTAAGTSSPQSVPPGTSLALPTQLPIKTGDAIGVDNTSNAILFGVNAGATLVYWSPLLAGGATLMGTSFAAREAQIQANVEPDVDCDGKGDETQDTNLSDGPCKAPPVQTLSAKKKQKLAKAAVTDTVDKSATVSVQAKVKLPGRSGSSRSLRVLARAVKSKTSAATLAAGTKTKIKLRFSAKARKKVKAAIRDFGPRKVVVAAKASDTFGNSSTAKVRFKLVG
jgi:hypothetical protein